MHTKKGLHPIFWVESVLATLTAVLFVVTFFWNDWIEIVFRTDPDGGNGSFEKLIIGVLLVITLALYSLAGFELRKARTALA
ncbi:MAG: ABC transporter permease [Ktedonobacteraceae bacterium]